MLSFHSELWLKLVLCYKYTVEVIKQSLRVKDKQSLFPSMLLNHCMGSEKLLAFPATVGMGIVRQRSTKSSWHESRPFGMLNALNLMSLVIL